MNSKLIESHALFINNKLKEEIEQINSYEGEGDIYDYSIMFSFNYKIDDETIDDFEDIYGTAAAQFKKEWDGVNHAPCPIQKVTRLELSPDMELFNIESYELDELEQHKLMDYIISECSIFEDEEFYIEDFWKQTSQYSTSQQQWYPDEEIDGAVMATINLNSFAWF